MDRVSVTKTNAAGLGPFAWATLVLVASAIVVYLYNT